MKSSKTEDLKALWSGLAPVIRWVGGVLVAGVIVWILVRTLDWKALSDALAAADYRWILFGIFTIVGTIVARALRWRALLHEGNLSVWTSVTAILAAQVVNVAVPVMRSGDITRAVWVSQRQNARLPQALGSIALEKVWDLLALCATGTALLVTVPLPEWFAQSTWGMLTTVGLGMMVLYLGLHWQRPLLDLVSRILTRLPANAGSFLMPHLNQLVRALDAVRQPRTSLEAALWTLMTWALGGVANWATMSAFGVGSPGAAAFLLAALMLGGAVVPVPGRLGVFEGICVVSLALFGIDRNLALAIGLVLHLVVLGPPLIIAGLLALVNAWTGMSGRLKPVDGEIR